MKKSTEKVIDHVYDPKLSNKDVAVRSGVLALLAVMLYGAFKSINYLDDYARHEYLDNVPEIQ